MLLITYTIAIALTVVSDEAFTCVAWDSAGTTTSEVTVPIVLAIGLGVGKAINVQVGALGFAVWGLGFGVCVAAHTAQDTFGILAMASVFPIIRCVLWGLRCVVCGLRFSV